MSQSIAVVGESGSGKSSSIAQVPELGIIGLNPEETFIINVKGKPLPMRGWKSKYTPVPNITSGPPVTGNYLSTTDTGVIIKVMQFINANRPEIKHLILDDGQYVMSEEFMANALKSGWRDHALYKSL